MANSGTENRDRNACKMLGGADQISPTWFVALVVALAVSLAPEPAWGQAQAPTRTPRLWAVVASVEEYGRGLQGRPGLRAEGQRLARWVTGSARWPSENVLELNENGVARPRPGAQRQEILEANARNLDYAMRDWLDERGVGEGDVVLFAFAGRAAATASGDRLLPFGTRPEDLAGTGWSPEKAIERLLRDRKCSAVLSWIDAPFVPERPGAAPALSKKGLPGEGLLDRLSRWPGASVWLSTSEKPDSVSQRGSAFASAVRSALGDQPRTLMAALAALDRDLAAQQAPFRQRGGFSADLHLFHDNLRLPRMRGTELLVQKGHAARITALAVRADGRTLVTASEDSTLRLWRLTATERALVRVLPEFLNGVTSLALSPDGRYLAGGDGMGKVAAWDLNVPEAGPILTEGPPAHTKQVLALTFLRDEPELAAGAKKPSAVGSGRRLVSLGQDGRCVAWTLEDRVLRHKNTPVVADVVTAISAATVPGGTASFALVTGEGRLLAFDRESLPVGVPVRLASGLPEALHLAADGRRAVVGFETGGAAIVALPTGLVKPIGGAPLPGPVKSVRFGPRGLLAIGAADGVYLADIDRDGTASRLKGVDGPSQSVDFAPSGDWLAACSATGELALWPLVDGKATGTVSLPGAAPDAPLTCVAFAPASGPPLLVAGDGEGGVSRWDLRTRLALPRLTPHRGRVARVSITREGRYLLQITGDGIALIWDLQQGREVRTLPGRWSTGVFRADGKLVMARHPDDGGGIFVVDRVEGRIDPEALYPSPPQVDGDYASLVVSRDGKRVAALPAHGRGEVVYLWDSPGKLPRIIAAHDRTPTALDFSADGNQLLTAGKDGKIKLWNVAGGGEPRVTATLEEPLVEEFEAARFDPDHPERIVAAGRTGSSDRYILIFDKGRSKRLGTLQAPVYAITFLERGKYVAASGHDRRIRIWPADDNRQGEPLQVVVDASNPNAPNAGTGRGSSAHHSEAINDLLPWPLLQGPKLVSASDDTTIRFWSIERVDQQLRTSLLGTLTSAPGELDLDPDAVEGGNGDGRGNPAPPPAPAMPPRRVAERGEVPWVAFTPEGVYDGSREGDRLVCFVQGDTVAPIDQFVQRFFRPLLTDQLRQGVRPVSKPFTPPPPLLLDASDDLDPANPTAKIKVTLCDPLLKRDQLRLFHNDTPVREDTDFAPGDEPGTFLVDLRLTRGENRVYALAGRPGDVDARSPDLILPYTGPEKAARTHVISLGVGNYRKNALLYPGADASELAAYLGSHGVGTAPTVGQSIALIDSQVTEKAVEKAFEEVRRDVRDNPQDVVVVFLAGHTDVVTDANDRPRFSLLLSDFDFPAGTPERAVLRGPNVAEGVVKPRVHTFLPYAAIDRHLSHLHALRRLVIVDACQAELIQEDTSVRAARQFRAMEQESRPTRTSYFLAARPGESAREAPLLRHGVLTYVLLRGMGSPTLVAPPGDLSIFRQFPNADSNGDRRVTTRELHRYVDRTLPSLAMRVDGMMRAAAPPELAVAGPGLTPPQTPLIQTAGASFPLVELSGGALPTSRPVGDGGN